MKILHYTLGLPPMRSGGLTRYATDLMTAQSSRHEVTLLYPGGYNLFSRSCKFVKQPAYAQIQIYALQNPVIVPLLYGISNPDSILQPSSRFSQERLERFYQEVQPDILHLHTLMGLPLQLLAFFREKGVKIVYSTHDHFGLCPRVNFIDHCGNVCHGASGEKCAQCNKSAPSSAFLRLRNSRFLLSLKNKKWVRKMRK